MTGLLASSLTSWNRDCAVAKHDFCRIHKTVKVGPAMKAEIANHVWATEEVLALIPEQAPKKHGPYENAVRKIAAEPLPALAVATTGCSPCVTEVAASRWHGRGSGARAPFEATSGLSEFGSLLGAKSSSLTASDADCRASIEDIWCVVTARGSDCLYCGAMPEGDTIHQIAQALRPMLVGYEVERVHLARGDGRALCGQVVTAVRSHGKQLFIDFASGLTLRSHLGLYGSWHRYAHGEPWRKPRWQAGIVLETADLCLVCFHPRQVAVESTAASTSRELMQRLGPDLAAADVDTATCVRRARALLSAETPLLDVLLDQRVAAGIGNVYKSEVLFLCGLTPTRLLADISDAQVTDLYLKASELMRLNLGGGRRITRFVDDGRGGLWVYRRGDRPCFHCGCAIRMARLGRDRRSTYWCPVCQS